MPLTITGGSTNLMISKVEYDLERKGFLCFEDSTLDPFFTQYLPFVLEELPSTEFTEKIYLFKNTFYPSARLLTIEFKERIGDAKTVGYAFTIDDLINNSEIFDTIHLKKVAFNVLNKLLKEETISIPSKTTPYRQDADYKLFDFYDQDTIIIVICDQFVNFNGYKFSDYLTSFHKYGFRYSPEQNFYPPQNDSEIVQNNFNSIKNRLKLTASKNDLCTNYFIKELISNFIYSSKDNEVARFHLFYQVVEMLMEKVLKVEVKTKLDNELETLSGYETKDFFRELMKDSYILDKVMGDKYSAISENIKSELSTNIIAFLSYAKIVVPSEFSAKLYKVRNTLFHGYSKILENDSLKKQRTYSLLKKLNDSFELLVMELIYTYKT